MEARTLSAVTAHLARVREGLGTRDATDVRERASRSHAHAAAVHRQAAEVHQAAANLFEQHAAEMAGVDPAAAERAQRRADREREAVNREAAAAADEQAEADGQASAS